MQFYAVHRILHWRKVYSLVHRTHHEHVSPSLWTNYHFSLTDLILEAFAPFAIALVVMHTGLGLHTTQHERYGLLSYTMWFEIGSHCGKSLPVLSWMPPISPLIRAVCGDVDDYNVTTTSNSGGVVNK